VASNDDEAGPVYDTLDDCCDDNFSSDGEYAGYYGGPPEEVCKSKDICETTDIITPVPTYSPTSMLTVTVSKETTGPPTMTANRGASRLLVT